MELWLGFTKRYAKKSKDNLNQLVCKEFSKTQPMTFGRKYTYTYRTYNIIFFLFHLLSVEKKLYANQNKSFKFLTRKHIQLYLNFVILVKEYQLTIPFFFQLKPIYKRYVNKNLKLECTKRFQLLEIRNDKEYKLTTQKTVYYERSLNNNWNQSSLEKLRCWK